MYSTGLKFTVTYISLAKKEYLSVKCGYTLMSSFFREMKVAMHNAAQKMLPIVFFLCIAVVTVDSENFGMSRTLLKIYLLLFYECTARFKIGSVNLELEPL